VRPNHSEAQLIQSGRVVLVNTIDFPCPGTHLLHVRRFLKSFKPFGYEYLEISDLNESERFLANDLVYFSSHGLRGSAPLTSKQLSFLQRVALPGAFPLFWYWHTHVEALESIFGNRYLLTGSTIRAEKIPDSYESLHAVSSATENYVAMDFASYLRPEQVGKLTRRENLNALFIGSRYQHEYNSVLRRRPYNARVIYTPPFLEEWYRVHSYLSAKTTLGWHNQENLELGIVVERVYDGLAFGSFVITDNPYAHAATEGLARYVGSLDELMEAIGQVLADREARAKSQALGYKWVASNGTYFHVAKKFLDKISLVRS
jgi:hypothetical protein